MTTDLSPWYHHPMFGRYWTHYSQSYSWYQHHLKADKSSNWDLHCGLNQIPYPVSVPAEPLAESCNCSTSSRRSSGNKKKSRRGFSRTRKNNKRNSLRGKSEKNSSSEVSFEMEITEDMIQFFRKSANHRKELRAEREKSKNGVDTDQEYIDCAKATSWEKPERRSILPPKEQPGAKRSEEMKRLYGAKFPTIKAMETAMQITFDRYCDLYQPKMWPVIPLKI